MANNRNELNKNLAQMLKGGVIMDVTTPEQAKIAQDAGACAVMALERIPADIRAAGGVSRMSDPAMIKGGAVNISTNDVSFQPTVNLGFNGRGDLASFPARFIRNARKALNPIL